MRSVRVTEGHQVSLVVVPDPDPAANQAVIEVAASSVNRGELTLIGMRDAGWGPGQDVSGVVVSPAADGSGPPLGTRVIGLAEAGAWSERVAVEARRLAPVPDGVDLSTAAALPMAGLTALRTLRKLGSVLGRDVLITGAGGGVGGLQVQLAALSGARVTALVRHQRSIPGAHTVTSLAGDHRFDAALDGVGGDVLNAVVQALRPGSDLVWFGSTSGQAAPMSIYDFIGHEGVTIHTYFSYAADTAADPRDLHTLLALVQSGELAVEATERWPLAEADQAVEQLAAGGIRGKVLLTGSSDHR